MKISDLFIGSILMALGVGVLVYGLTLPPMPGQRYGAGLFPIMLGICFAGFGARLAHQGWRERGVEGTPLFSLGEWARDRRLLSNMFIVLVLIVVYVLLSERVGFILLSLAILTILFWRFGEPWLRGAIIAAVATLFIQFSFVDVLRVPLPRGLLDRLLW